MQNLLEKGTLELKEEVAVGDKMAGGQDAACY